MLGRKTIECDLCVVGGGMAGLAAAVSAAREGMQVVLMHERPVLGGNASSEIRMWICGSHGRDNRETGIIEEIALENLYRNPTKSFAIWDTVLYEAVKKEVNITLLLNCTCLDASTETGDFPDGRSVRIREVTGYQMTTQTFFDVKARFFCDSSGDSILAPLTGAEFRLGREGRDVFGENTDREKSDTMTMGMSCLLTGRETHEEIAYIPPSFATPLTEENFRDRDPDIRAEHENFWYLELGGDRNSIEDTELLRDELLGLATGTWDYIKNSGKFDAARWELDFLGFLPGKRESRRMCGEYTVTERDISSGTVFSDEVAYGGWPLDDHFPGGFYHRGVPNTAYQTPAPYSLPYRALYSKNVENLFFAGRNISMSHTAMSSIRVMATCALLGEAVGKAAALAVRHGLTPHGVYRERITDLQAALLAEDCFLPHVKREVSPACLASPLNVPCPDLRDGRDRAHALYGTEGAKYGYEAAFGQEISYTVDKNTVTAVHIVFDSDLNRDTLPGGWCERSHATRANRRLDSPQMTMPKTLCREFLLYGERDGERIPLLHVKENRRRAYHVPVGERLDRLTLVPVSSWGEGDRIRVISFDFT